MNFMTEVVKLLHLILKAYDNENASIFYDETSVLYTNNR